MAGDAAILAVGIDDHAPLFRRGLTDIFDEVRECWLAGRAFPFLTADGFFVLIPLSRSGTREVWVEAAYSEGGRDVLRSYIEPVRSLAREIGASVLRFRTKRRGFERIGPQIGFRRAGTEDGYTVWEQSL